MFSSQRRETGPPARGDMGPRLMRVLTDDPRFTPLHHAIGHGELIDWAAVHEDRTRDAGLRDGARALRGGIRDGATPDALRPHAGGAERRYARDARGSQHSAPPDGRRRRPAAIRGSRRAPRGRFRRHLHHRGHNMVRAAPGPRGRRRLRNRRHHRHDRDIVDARARRLCRRPPRDQLRLRARARRLRLRARHAIATFAPDLEKAGTAGARRRFPRPPPPPRSWRASTLDDDGGGGGGSKR